MPAVLISSLVRCVAVGARLSLLAAPALALAACDRGDAPAPMLRDVLAMHEALPQAGTPSHDTLRRAAERTLEVSGTRELDDAALGLVPAAPGALVVPELLELHARLDDARLRRGEDAIAAARYQRREGRALAEPCREALADAPRSPAAPTLSWRDGASRPRLEASLGGWLASCLEPGAVPAALTVEVVPAAPFLAAFWPDDAVVLLHPLAVELLAESHAAPAPPSERGRFVALEAPLHASSAGCLDELRSFCAACAGDRASPNCAEYLPVERFALPFTPQPSCLEVVTHTENHGWFESALCAAHLAWQHDACVSCVDPLFWQSCVQEQLPSGDNTVYGVSAYRFAGSPSCTATIDRCASSPEDACGEDPVIEPPSGAFAACTEALAGACEQCLAGAQSDGEPSDCRALFGFSTIEQDCVDLGYPLFEDASRLSMFCAWKSTARPSCLNAHATCVRSEVEVASFDGLVLGYGAFADPALAPACIDQVLACEAQMGIDPIPEDTSPPWLEPDEQSNTSQGDDDGINCGD